jgi:hypothetical protein
MVLLMGLVTLEDIIYAIEAFRVPRLRAVSNSALYRSDVSRRPEGSTKGWLG